MSIRLAVVEGQTLTRYGLRALAAEHSDIKIVAECASVAQAARLLAEARPDVVTVAVNLPDGQGLALARDLRGRRPDLGIVVLTSENEDDVLFRALEIGVSAFVAKTAPIGEILAAIRHAAVSASTFTASGLSVALNRRRGMQRRLALSPRQAEVLRMLGDGKSIPAIAQALHISQSTTKTYVSRLYEKLGAANRAQALMTAMRLGLIRYGGTTPRVVSVPAQPAAEPLQAPADPPGSAAPPAAVRAASSPASGDGYGEPRWRAVGRHATGVAGDPEDTPDRPFRPDISVSANGAAGRDAASRALEGFQADSYLSRLPGRWRFAPADLLLTMARIAW